ncbi:hypothetical protein [Tahibacter amnicola]|uniref:Delta-60 repeat protein n=1 Tax=Tahibacter amnicola TaxID=2976241 RepID=A0ABY6BHB7_9GAMM|nr:hypothetical protein [Tahibacter amnicola]UXI69413.1 hypothetical protein N4264_07125 [Tahibacter amnicola]
MDFSLARLLPDGTADAGFAGDGWSVFRIDALPVPEGHDGIDRLVVQRDGSIVIAGHYDAGESTVRLLAGRIRADGTPDPAYGDAALPGFRTLVTRADAGSEYATGLRLQSDGKLFLSIVTGVYPERSGFAAARLDAAGDLDPGFADGGIFALDLVPQGAFADAMAVTLQGGRPVLAGHARRDSGAQITELGLVRLENDLIFTDRLGD